MKFGYRIGIPLLPIFVNLYANNAVNHPLSSQTTTLFQESIRPMMEAACFECHGPNKEKSGIRFDKLDPLSLSEFDIENLSHVRDVLTYEEMPPEEADRQLTDTERQRLLAWIEQSLREVTAQKRSLESQPRLRRLTKREYNNTLRELFNAPSEFDTLLPPDPISEQGYDTAHKLLMISQVDLKIYMETARIALEKFMNFGEPNGEKERFFIEIEDVYTYCRGKGETLSKERAPASLSPIEFAEAKAAHHQSPTTYRNRKYGPLPFGYIDHGVVSGVDEGIGFARLHSQFLLIRTKQRTGEVVVRVHAAATRGADGSFPRMRLEAGRRSVQNLKVINGGEYDITAPQSDPGVYEFHFRLENALQISLGSEEDRKFEHMLFVISNVARNDNGVLAASVEGQDDPSLWDSYKPATAIRSQTLSAIEQTKKAMATWEAAQTNFLHLDAIEVEILPSKNDPENPWNLTAPDSPKTERDFANKTLNTFLPKIFRRPLQTGEFKRYYRLYQKLREEGQDHKTALVDTFVAAMVSPSFLYIGKPAEDLPYTDSLAFASKLAYFLWASPPDEKLIRLAANGKLRNRKTLAAEIDRMLADPKSERFSATFIEQWLALQYLDEIKIDYELYPEYGPELANLTKRQTIETFQETFHSGMDARQLFHSDRTLLNDLLARHYGLPSIDGGDLRPVPTPRTRQAGGILTHASVLTMNSDGKQSHPVKRGAWLLERILHDPPPPPPPAVPDLDPSSADNRHLSLKDRIALHRQQNGCTNCHNKIDPWGIAFESFDATGRWLDPNSAPFLIDSSTRLPDGTELSGAADLAEYMLESKETEMMHAIVKSLMTYAVGAELDILDEAEINQVFTSFQKSGYNMKSLAKAIAQTQKFDPIFNAL